MDDESQNCVRRELDAADEPANECGEREREQDEQECEGGVCELKREGECNEDESERDPAANEEQAHEYEHERQHHAEEEIEREEAEREQEAPEHHEEEHHGHHEEEQRGHHEEEQRGQDEVEAEAEAEVEAEVAKAEEQPEEQPEPEPEPEPAAHEFQAHAEVKHAEAPHFEEPEPAPAPAPAPAPHVDERPKVHVDLHAAADVHVSAHAEPATTPTRHEAEQPSVVKPSAMAKDKSPSPGVVGADACRACGKKVYPMEKLVADKNLFHKTCFRCKKCNRILSSSDYATLGSDYYCKPHQRELFRLQGRYEVSETHAEVVNRSNNDAPAADGSASQPESNAEDLRRARAMFQQGEQSSPQSAGAHAQATPQYGGVGNIKAKFAANAQNNEPNRPPPRKITPPRHEGPAVKTNGDEAHQFENDPVQMEGVVRETDRAQFQAELPKQGSAKSAMAMFRNLETTSKAGASVTVSVSDSKPRHSPTLENDQ